MIPERRRLTYALLASLLIHTWLLSLTFGGQGLWVPGFGLPWNRRIDAPDLNVVVVPPQGTAAEPAVTPAAELLQHAWVEQPVSSEPAPTAESQAPILQRVAPAIVPKADRRAEANPGKDAASGAAPAQMPLRADRRGDKAVPSIPAPAVIAVAPIDEDTWVVPAIPEMQAPVIAAEPSASSPETAMPSLRDTSNAAGARIAQEPLERAAELAKATPSKQEEQRQAEQLEATRQEAARAENARLEAARAEAARIEAARVEAERAEAARVEATRVEAERAEAARVEAARVEAAHVEAKRAEAARVEAARIEAARVEAARVEEARIEVARIEAERAEAARVEAARAEAARIEAARAEAARIEAARAEAARVAAARAEAARVEAEQVEAERREAARRAIGRQLDEEAARRDAAMALADPSRLLPPPWSSARRYRLFGRADPNAELIQYAEAWALKIQMNMTFDMVREAAKQPHRDPLVWVAIRSDGSVEAVTFVFSSGVAALDEAIRRVVDSQKPYRAFPPELSRLYDVIEIRRTWHFDTAIRLY